MFRWCRKAGKTGFVLAVGLTAAQASAQPITIADQGFFYVGGSYVDNGEAKGMAGQMYVQYQIPAEQTKAYPLVMIHGGNQTGTNFLQTPDGREGWATYFLRQGYAVYVVDQVGRGRSGFFGAIYGQTRVPDAKRVESRFTRPEGRLQYPQAADHNQWPGAGGVGDPVFDNFFKSQVEDIAAAPEIERRNRAVGSALFARTGPAILITHSQSGPIGWGLTNDNPGMVMGIVAVEPSGPPFYDVAYVKPPVWFEDAKVGREHGVTRTPMTYDPPASGPADFKLLRQEKPDREDVVRCWLQEEPLRTLPNLEGVPVLIVSGEASYHTPYDHCTGRFLAQAGVANDYVRLSDVGIRGNGHMMMLEKNNLEIAAYFADWLDKNVE